MADNSTDSPNGGADELEVSLPVVGSKPSAGEPSSAVGPVIFDDAQMGRLAETLTAMIAPTLRETLRPDIERQFQSTKDVRFKKLEQLNPEDVSLVAEALKQAGGDVTKAAESLGLQALLEERRAGKAPAPATAAQAAPVSTEVGDATEADRIKQVKKVLGDSGLTTEEATIVLDSWGKKSFATIEDSLAELTKMAIAQTRPAQSISAGAVIPPGVSAIGQENNEPVLVELYTELGDLQREPTKNAVRITEVKDNLRKLGEEIL